MRLDYTLPTTLPVDLTRVKDYLRVNVTDDDTEITSMILVGTDVIEAYTRRSLITRSITMYLDWSESYAPIVLPRPPFVSLTSFEAWDDDTDAFAAVSGDAYVVSSNGDAQILESDDAIVPDGNYPFGGDRDIDALKVVWDAGYGSAETDIPDWAQLSIMQFVQDAYYGNSDKLWMMTAKRYRYTGFGV